MKSLWPGVPSAPGRSGSTWTTWNQSSGTPQCPCPVKRKLDQSKIGKTRRKSTLYPLCGVALNFEKDMIFWCSWRMGRTFYVDEDPEIIVWLDMIHSQQSWEFNCIKLAAALGQYQGSKRSESHVSFGRPRIHKAKQTYLVHILTIFNHVQLRGPCFSLRL